MSVRWVGFGMCNALTRSIVHFLPSEGGVTAPYPVQCQVSLFGKDFTPQKVVLEGARISHPDGIRVDDAFPVLTSSGVSIFGLDIELDSVHPRGDVLGSSCVVEFFSKSGGTRYWPFKIRDEASSKSGGDFAAERTTDLNIRYGILGKDCFNGSCLVLINNSSSNITPEVNIIIDGQGVSAEAPQMGPWEVLELPIPERLIAKAPCLHTSWGTMSLPLVQLKNQPADGLLLGYIMLRDSVSKRPVSIKVL